MVLDSNPRRPSMVAAPTGKPSVQQRVGNAPWLRRSLLTSSMVHFQVLPRGSCSSMSEVPLRHTKTEALFFSRIFSGLCLMSQSFNRCHQIQISFKIRRWRPYMWTGSEVEVAVMFLIRIVLGILSLLLSLFSVIIPSINHLDNVWRQPSRSCCRPWLESWVITINHSPTVIIISIFTTMDIHHSYQISELSMIDI